MRNLCLLFIVALLTASFAGCSSSGWIGSDEFISNSTIHIESPDSLVFKLDDRRLNAEYRQSLISSEADSLAKSAFDRIQQVYIRSGEVSTELTENPEEADYILRIDEISIRAIRTMNFVHPGPVFRIRVSVSAWRGDRKVFEQTKVSDTNLAITAADGRRFYNPDAEERMDFELQQLSVSPALRSLFGAIWQDFFDANRKMQ